MILFIQTSVNNSKIRGESLRRHETREQFRDLGIEELEVQAARDSAIFRSILSASKTGFTAEAQRSQRGFYVCDPIARGDWITNPMPSAIKGNRESMAMGTTIEAHPQTRRAFLFGGLLPPNKKTTSSAPSASLQWKFYFGQKWLPHESQINCLYKQTLFTET